MFLDSVDESTTKTDLTICQQLFHNSHPLQLVRALPRDAKLKKEVTHKADETDD